MASGASRIASVGGNARVITSTAGTAKDGSSSARRPSGTGSASGGSSARGTRGPRSSSRGPDRRRTSGPARRPGRDRPPRTTLREVSGRAQQLDEQRRADEAGGVDPPFVERVEHRSLIGGRAGPSRLERETVRCLVALAGEEGEVVAEHVQRDALDRPCRTLRRSLPRVGGQRAQQIEQLGPLEGQERDGVVRRHGVRHGLTLGSSKA